MQSRFARWRDHQSYSDYCPNADTLEALKLEKSLVSEK